MNIPYLMPSTKEDAGAVKNLSHHDPSPNDLQDFLGLFFGFSVVRRDVGKRKHKKALSAGVSHRKLFIDLDMPRDEICIREPAESLEKLESCHVDASSDADDKLLTSNSKSLLPRFVLAHAN
jgi:hypothetical protein